MDRIAHSPRALLCLFFCMCGLLIGAGCAAEEAAPLCSQPPASGCQEDNPPWLRLIGGGSSCIALALDCGEGELEYEDVCGCGCYTPQWCVN